MGKRVRTRNWRIEVEGAEEVVELLQSMEDAAIGILDKAAKAGADIAISDAKRRCPVKTGNLRDSLEFYKEKSSKNTRAGYQVRPGKKGWYGKFIEFGTSKRPARPFLRPALDNNRNQIEAEVRRTIQKELEGIN